MHYSTACTTRLILEIPMRPCTSSAVISYKITASDDYRFSSCMQIH